MMFRKIAQEEFKTESQKFPLVVEMSDEFYNYLTNKKYDDAKSVIEEMKQFYINADTPELNNKIQQMLAYMNESYLEALKRRTFEQDPQVIDEQKSINERDAVRGEETFTYKEVIEKLKGLYLSKQFDKAETYLQGQLNFNRLFEDPAKSNALQQQFERIKSSVTYKQDYNAYHRFFYKALEYLDKAKLPPSEKNIKSLMRQLFKYATEPLDESYLDAFIQNSNNLQFKNQITRF